MKKQRSKKDDPAPSPPNTKPSPWLGAAPALASFALYFYTGAPGVTTLDSGEFAMVTRTLDIGHPPGVPTYVLLGHLFTALPIASEIARRSNLYSATAAALTVWVAYHLVRELFRELDPRMAAASALAFGFSLSLWHWAVVTEVYALNVLLVAIVFWLAARGQWIGAALAAGIALGVHHATVAMALPAAAYLAWQRKRPTIRDLALATGAMAVGLCVYLYLPIRAAQSPTLDWGDPRTLERFWWHLTGVQYRSGALAPPAEGIVLRINEFFSLWIMQMAPFGCLVALAGLWTMWRRHRTILWFTAIGMFCNLAFVWFNNLGGYDLAGYYMPVFLTATWCFALGADSAVNWMSRKRATWAIAIVFAIAAAPLLFHFQTNNHREDRIAPLLLENTFRGVPPNSLILTSDWEIFAPWLYMRFVQDFRPDVMVVETQLLRTGWYLDHLERVYPATMREAAPEAARFRHLVDEYQHQRVHDNGVMNDAFMELINKFIALKKAQGAGVFHTLELEPLVEPQEPVAPHGLLFAYAEGSEDVDLDLTGLQGEMPLDKIGQRIRRDYSAMFTARAIYARRMNDTMTEQQKLDQALRLDPGNEQAKRMRSALP